MGGNDLQASWAIFLLCFPFSVWLWSGLLIGTGFVRDVQVMPWEFRLAARINGDDMSAYSRSRFDVGVVLLMLAVVNFVPVVVVVHPYGPISWVAAVVYVVVQLLWLLRIRRAVQRANQQ